MRRTIDRPELLDGPLDDPEMLRGNLRDLRRINHGLGGVRLSGAALDALVGTAGAEAVPLDEAPAARATIRMLDVGTGAADIPIALIRRSRGGPRRDGVPWLRVTGIDDRLEVLAAARTLGPGLSAAVSSGALTLEVGDGRSLPYPDDSFDVAHCSLVVHHLAPDAALAMLREMARVARSGIIVNDLVRSRLALVGAWALTRLMTRNAYTRHDAPLSVRRAYAQDELRSMIEAAGLVIAWEGGGLLGHRWAVAARRRAR